VLTLDAFVREQGLRVDFVKADIEGWEGRLLEGARQTLREQRPALLLEIDDRLMAKAGDSAAALFGQLSGMDYRAFSLQSGSDVPSFAGAGDYLFRPPARPG
jgi:hypothetical protein